MLRKTLLVLGILVALPNAAQAQFSTYLYPLEKGHLDSHVDLQLQYSHFSEERPLGDLTVDRVILSLEAQYVIARLLEISVNVPMLVHTDGTATAGALSLGGDSTEFGDIVLGLKGRVFGTKILAVAAYLDASLPTHSWDGDRDYSRLNFGGAIDVDFMNILVGGGVGATWMTIGGDVEDVGLLGFDFWGGYRLFGMLSATLAFQFKQQVGSEGDNATALYITPAAELNPFAGLRVGAGVRIAATDDARLLQLTRAQLLFHAGYSF